MVGDPALGFAGNAGISSESRLWGFEVNASRRPAGGRDIRLLAGFRYLSLDEDLTLTNTTTDAVLGQSTTIRDCFATENQFYGWQLGARGTVSRGWLTAGLTAKVALG